MHIRALVLFSRSPKRVGNVEITNKESQTLCVEEINTFIYLFVNTLGQHEPYISYLGNLLDILRRNCVVTMFSGKKEIQRQQEKEQHEIECKADERYILNLKIFAENCKP